MLYFSHEYIVSCFPDDGSEIELKVETLYRPGADLLWGAGGGASHLVVSSTPLEKSSTTLKKSA